jgi:hypothetical protein
MAMNSDVWKTHCRHMAEATHALADWCDDVEMLRAYLELAAAWIRMGDGPPPAEPFASYEPTAENRPGDDACP